ncbi:hypothetical protein [Cylindrospermum sp. FACHB-282]|uniref:hypothetical protein n=1 Tax=Cylindrospermum sp. FACHB-282 TaxID=2692794 RepID=UPI001685395F|nr:hypothetical protein [Cylindrospermum sp. FACHB-282]MBD2387344.1 hypothetical protein [Cylindrospermum sp. FACHB-282]
MAVNLNIQADVIDIRNDTPKQEDIFFVDTNVWLWLTYTNARLSGAKYYQLNNYPKYLKQARSNQATLTYSGLILAELAHVIERTEFDIYVQSHQHYLPQDFRLKDFRHNYPTERANVVAEVQLSWIQIKDFAHSADLTVNEATTDAAVNRLETQAVDGYDLLLLESISRAGVGQIKIITDDIDYAVVPDIQIFTSNDNMIRPAKTQKRLVVR